MSCKLEPAIWSRDTGQRIPSFDRCQLIITWMSNIKKVHGKQRLHVCQPIIWSMAAMLRDSVVVVAVVRTRPRAIPLAMITMRKSTHGFPFLFCMSMGLRLAALRAAGAPLMSSIYFFLSTRAWYMTWRDVADLIKWTVTMGANVLNLLDSFWNSSAKGSCWRDNKKFEFSVQWRGCSKVLEQNVNERERLNAREKPLKVFDNLNFF